MTLKSILRERIVDPIRRAQGTPESIARGGALGLWIALTPTVGLQMTIAALLAVPLRANLPVALAMCWLTNPITVIPFYFSFYWLGTLLLGEQAAGYSAVAARIQEQVAAVGSQGLLDSLQALGSQILWPMTVGSFVMATTCAIPTYHLLLWLARRRRERELLEKLEQGELEIVEVAGGRGALPARSGPVDPGPAGPAAPPVVPTGLGAPPAGPRPARPTPSEEQT